MLFPDCGRHRIGTPEGIAINLGEIKATAINGNTADFNQIGGDFHAWHDLPCHRAGGHATCGFARRGAPATARIAQSVFGIIGIIGVAGPVFGGDVAIILRTLIDILDHQADRRAGGLSFIHARQDADFIRLLPLGGEFRLAGPALVEEGLDIGFGQDEPGRAAIDHRADRRAVAFAPGGEAQQVSECVEAHFSSPISGASSAFMPMTL